MRGGRSQEGMLFTGIWNTPCRELRINLAKKTYLLRKKVCFISKLARQFVMRMIMCVDRCDGINFVWHGKQ